MKKNSLKKAVCIGVTGIMIAALATGCGKKEDDAALFESIPESTTEEVKTEEKNTSVANPWRTCTEEEAKNACVRLFKAPDNAEVNSWTMMDSAAGESGVPGPVIQLDFSLDGQSYTARAQYGASEDADIAGMYYDWTVSDDVTLANWGEGHMQGKTHRYIGDNGMVDLITWYDIEIGIAYSLSVEAADLEGFDIQAIAEQMYDPANEPYVGMPEDEGDAQNPMDDFAGQYYLGRGNLSITPQGADSALIEVWWGSSASEHSEWVMHGTFDQSTMTITYSDCEKHDYTLKDNGEVESDVTAYTNGTGNIKKTGENTIVWTDDQDHIADDLEMSR